MFHQSVEVLWGPLRIVFEYCFPGWQTAQGLLALRQGNSWVADHAIRVQALVAYSECNSPSVSNMFMHSLSNDIKDHLVPLDLPQALISYLNSAKKK